jgi:deoxyribonuclease-1
MKTGIGAVLGAVVLLSCGEVVVRDPESRGRTSGNEQASEHDEVGVTEAPTEGPVRDDDAGWKPDESDFVDPSGDAGVIVVGETEPAAPFRVATFNLQVFGPKKSSSHEVLSVVAGVVRRYPLVAVQEVKDASMQSADVLLAAINEQEGPTYAMVESPRSGLAPDDRTSQEQYVYYFDTERVVSLDDGILYADDADLFQREPHVARFAVGGWDFALVNVHTAPSRAVSEIGALDLVAKWASAHYDGELDVIVLGDFNAGCSYASPDELDMLDIRGPGYVWLVPDDADTNVASARCAYDRIVVTDVAADAATGAWGVEPWEGETKGVSDHWPVWAEFVSRHDGGQ